jgi:two-component system, OmpR family, KDP operon response regulator KdpE
MSLAPPTAPLVQLVEDDAPMRRFLRTYLTGAGYRLQEAGTGEEALALASRSPPDVVILDLGLPDMDGQDVMRKLRSWLESPIIILSARDQDVQKIAALDQGADDYLTKPFSTGELLARIRVALRHAADKQSGHQAPTFESGDLRVDLAARKVFVAGAEVRLTPIEYKLLVTLVRQSGRVLTHQYLLQEVWGAKRVQDTQHLRVFMADRCSRTMFLDRYSRTTANARHVRAATRALSNAFP